MAHWTNRRTLANRKFRIDAMEDAATSKPSGNKLTLIGQKGTGRAQRDARAIANEYTLSTLQAQSMWRMKQGDHRISQLLRYHVYFLVARNSDVHSVLVKPIPFKCLALFRSSRSVTPGRCRNWPSSVMMPAPEFGKMRKFPKFFCVSSQHRQFPRVRCDPGLISKSDYYPD